MIIEIFKIIGMVFIGLIGILVIQSIIYLVLYAIIYVLEGRRDD